MQTNSKVQGQWACFKNILFTEGIRGVFKGTLVTFARDMPSFATYFVVYDLMRHKFKESRIDLGPVGITIVSGATAGIAGKAKLYLESFFSHPLFSSISNIDSSYLTAVDMLNKCTF